jgi:hypothetical protein
MTNKTKETKPEDNQSFPKSESSNNCIILPKVPKKSIEPGAGSPEHEYNMNKDLSFSLFIEYFKQNDSHFENDCNTLR